MNRKCVATARTGRPCGNRPLRGGTVCRFHGGAAPQVRAAANRRIAEATAKDMLRRMDVEPVTDPAGELLAVIAEARGLKDVLRERYADARREDEAALVGAYGQAIDRVGKLLVDWTRLGLEERLVRVTERQGAMLAAVLRAAIDALHARLLDQMPAGEARIIASRVFQEDAGAIVRDAIERRVVGDAIGRRDVEQPEPEPEPEPARVDRPRDSERVRLLAQTLGETRP